MRGARVFSCPGLSSIAILGVEELVIVVRAYLCEANDVIFMEGEVATERVLLLVVWNSLAPLRWQRPAFGIAASG